MLEEFSQKFWPKFSSKISSKRKEVIIGVAILLVILLIVGVVGFKELDKKNQEFKTIYSPEKAEEQAKNLVSKVSEIYILPNELPTVATVTDKSKLSDPFFKDAKEGDKVLIFSNAKKVILYRESTNKIIDVAPLSVPSLIITPIGSTSGTLDSGPKIIFVPVATSSSN